MVWKKMLPVGKMEELETWLSDNGPEPGLSEQSLSEALNLKVEYVSPNELEDHTEAELRPIADSAYNGLIRVNSRERDERFAYLHEIMHYLRDVGKGNRVQQVFTRKSKGRTENQHEQEINYMTAAYRMPYTKMELALREYDCASPKMDEVRFVSGLAAAYHMSSETVIRRIREVRALKKHRKAR